MNLLRIAYRLLRNRNFLLVMAFVLGIALGQVASWTEQLTLPALALVMTVSIVQISTKAFLPLRKLVHPMLLAVAFNYVVLSTVMLALAWWLMPNRELWIGFVVVAAAPPGVAVIPFTHILAGDTAFSLVGTVGAYLAALVITPAMFLLWVGESFLQPLELLIILVELIVVPVVLSRLLLLAGLAQHIEKWRGTIVNWGFFLVIFTVVGLNREMFLERPEIVGLASAVAVVSIFVLGYLINIALKKLGVKRATRVSLTLMGTVKNSGVAAATALALFSERASVPGAVVSVFNVLYLIYLGLRAEQK
jgi:BASS family bile acid:Na+ symporter